MITIVQTIWTVVAFVMFIGVVIWAFGSGRKAEFDKAARMAMDDDKPISNSETNQE
ncbi:MAG: cbb3-type cytochrome c oxidase subunit 3 [Gammaproteobacteria bacterium]|nr:cbb3-type cytochrome c oxidase subunit 3 [Gammaproteobacteria bacterium]